MTINLIDARRGLHNKCLELFADKKIAEQIYRYLCGGIEDCEEVDSVKHGRWIPSKDGHGCECSECGARMDTQIGEDKSHQFAESVMMGMDGGEE